MAGIYNNARMTVAEAVGFESVVPLGAPPTNFKSFDEAGIGDFSHQNYLIIDGLEREVGIGSYFSSDLTFHREQALESTNGQGKLYLTAAATISILAYTQDDLVGSVREYAGAGADPPIGWLWCYGQSVAVTDYPRLFIVLGYTYGGAGANFNIPDLRGRVVAGKDNMGGVSANRLTGLTDGVDGDVLGATGGLETQAGGAIAGAAGTDLSLNNVQPTIVLNKIIKAT